MPPPKQNSSQRRNLFLWLVLSSLPLMVLALDLAFFPRLLQQRTLNETLDVSSLVEKGQIHLGTIHSVSLKVAYESLSETQSLSYFSGSERRGLVVSAYVDPGKPPERRVYEGEVSRAVRNRLASLSPTAAQQLDDAIGLMVDRRGGDVVGIDLNLSSSERGQFPVDRLILVALNLANAPEDEKVLEKALTGVLADAERAGLKALALPCVGYRPDKLDTLTFDQILRLVFKSLKDSHHPFDLVISFYSRWEIPVLEKAVAAVNSAWATDGASAGGPLPSFYRGRYRMLLLAATLCLLICTFRTKRTIKSFLLIFCTYVGTALGLAEGVEYFTRNYPDQLIELIVGIMWLVLAAVFFKIVGWDIKDVFPPGESEPAQSQPEVTVGANTPSLPNSNISDRPAQTAQAPPTTTDTLSNGRAAPRPMPAGTHENRGATQLSDEVKPIKT